MMRARWFLCWHEHELDLSCFVVLRLDWTREPRLKYGFEMDWRLLYRSQTGHTFKQKRKMIKQKVSLHWLCDCDGIGNPVVFGCFFLFLFWHFCYWVVSHGTRSQGSFFCRSASSHCQGLWPKSLLLPTSRIVCFGISDPNKTQEGNPRFARKKNRNQLFRALNLKQKHKLDIDL